MCQIPFYPFFIVFVFPIHILCNKSPYLNTIDRDVKRTEGVAYECILEIFAFYSINSTLEQFM